MTREVADALRRFYRELEIEIDRLGWTCRACGDCCRFAEFGHGLFCSEIEADYLADGEAVPDVIPDDVCVFLQDGRCARRDRRALGCRTYFCESTGAVEPAALSEQWVRRLKDLHERLGIAWRYTPLSEHLRRRKQREDKG